ncbi:hypothetical protein AB1L05_13105 [Cytobacillus horneckiae]|uniref:hypothetical protein n=1 Tax=Cytobacillus horneckiae TaxID=549687 RepID=UPI0039A09172
MELTKEQRYYTQKGKKYRTFDGFGNHWDIEVLNVKYHPEGYLWVEHCTMKNDSGEWVDCDGSRLQGFIIDIQCGRTIEVD